MRNKVTVALIMVVIIIGACQQIGQKSPSEVVESAYMTANEGKYSEVEKYLSSQALEVIKGEMGALVGGMKGAWDKTTRNGTIEKIEIIDEKIRGEGATVRFKLYFKDGRIKEDDEPLIMENGAWKLTIG